MHTEMNPEKIDPELSIGLTNIVKARDLEKLCHATEEGNLKEVTGIFDNSALTAAEMSRPLWLAVTNGWLSIAKFFKDKGANLKETDANGANLIHEAAKRNYFHIAHYLREQGVNINHQDKNGQTPLHFAAALGNLQMCLDLIYFDAKIHPLNNQHFTPKDYANTNDHQELYEVLRVIEDEPYLFSDYHELLTIKKQAFSGDLESIQLSHFKESDFNKNCLFFAAAGGHVRIIEYIDQRGADLNMVISRNSAYIRTLIYRNNCYLKEDRININALWIAVSNGRVPVVSKLVQKGVDFKQTYGSGTNIHGLLHVAVSSGSLVMVRFLCDLGINLELKDKNLDRPLEVARKRGFQAIVVYLESKMKNIAALGSSTAHSFTSARTNSLDGQLRVSTTIDQDEFLADELSTTFKRLIRSKPDSFKKSGG